jgi:hypothetical protein
LTAKQPAPATKASASSELRAAKAVPNDVVKVVQGDLNMEGYNLKVDGLMGKDTGRLSSNIGRKKALR